MLPRPPQPPADDRAQAQIRADGIAALEAGIRERMREQPDLIAMSDTRLAAVAELLVRPRNGSGSVTGSTADGDCTTEGHSVAGFRRSITQHRSEQHSITG